MAFLDLGERLAVKARGSSGSCKTEQTATPLGTLLGVPPRSSPPAGGKPKRDRLVLTNLAAGPQSRFQNRLPRRRRRRHPLQMRPAWAPLFPALAASSSRPGRTIPGLPSLPELPRRGEAAHPPPRILHALTQEAPLQPGQRAAKRLAQGAQAPLLQGPLLAAAPEGERPAGL